MKTINPKDIAAVYDTHNTYAEGGRKIHVLNYRTGRCLCGYGTELRQEVDLSHFRGNLSAYMQQADPDGNICLRCKDILARRLDPKAT